MALGDNSGISDVLKVIGNLFLCVIIFIAFIVIADFKSVNFYYPLVEQGKIFIPCLILFLLELTVITIIYYILKIFFASEKLSNFIILAIVALGYAVYDGNSVFAVYANSHYSSPNAKTYVIYAPLINKNHYITRHGRRSRSEVNHWEISLKSWLDDNKGISFEIPQEIFENCETSDILAIKIKSGFFHIDFVDYVGDIKRFPRSLFVEGAKFPMSEEEAKKHLIANNDEDMNK